MHNTLVSQHSYHMEETPCLAKAGVVHRRVSGTFLIVESSKHLAIAMEQSPGITITTSGLTGKKTKPKHYHLKGGLMLFGVQFQLHCLDLFRYYNIS